MTHVCVGKLTIIGSDNGLSPGRRQAIIWTNAGILLIGPLGTNSEILIEINTFSFKKMSLKMLSGKWQPFRLGLNVLTIGHFVQSSMRWIFHHHDSLHQWLPPNQTCITFLHPADSLLTWRQNSLSVWPWVPGMHASISDILSKPSYRETLSQNACKHTNMTSVETGDGVRRHLCMCNYAHGFLLIGPWETLMKFYKSNFQVNFSDWWLRGLL